MDRIPVAETLLTPREVADLFGVDPKTVTRWAKAGKLTSIRTTWLSDLSSSWSYYSANQKSGTSL